MALSVNNTKLLVRHWENPDLDVPVPYDVIPQRVSSVMENPMPTPVEPDLTVTSGISSLLTLPCRVVHTLLNAATPHANITLLLNSIYN